MSEVKEISGVSFIGLTDSSYKAKIQLNVLDGKSKEVLVRLLEALKSFL